ncbi:hypothetical protein KIN20_012807 [Parelaphostrongylus tenuis]|uniref:Uncharacterized protein n=1 Tax=Parelaphostrongylus tenuis TaxID=148309 RepID=A0AAD5MFP9_PARTN|nr:hypothetical protein KIN20_012807 [Parelaphostrongylus tenuis]
MKTLIWPINQHPEYLMKLIEKQSLKRLKKIRLCQPVIWPMISNVHDHSLYSPDLSLSDFHFFRTLEHWLDKKTF